MEKKIYKQFSFKYLLLISILLTVLLLNSFLLVHFNNLERQNRNEKNVVNEQELEEETLIPNENLELEIIEEVDTSQLENTSPEQPTQPSKTTSTTKTVPTTQSNDVVVIEEEVEEDDDQPQEPVPQEIPPESPSAYVAFYGDNQSDTDQEDLNHQRVVTYILNSGANPIFNVGDIMEDGTQDSLDRFNTVTSTLRSTRTFYSALGNNDRKIGDSSLPSQLYLDNFVYPNNEQWYSVNYGNLHLVVLDSAFSSTNQTQLNWLASDLQSSNSQNRITGVIFHHPTFFTTISSQLVNYGVDFVISGHYHSYSHNISSGINNFVLSGQPSIGYAVARIYSDRVSITVYNSSNTVIDNIEFSKR